MSRYRFRPRLTGRIILIAFISAVIITLVLVFLAGLESHRSIINNALISLSILSGLTFVFLSLGLYYAVRVEDDLSDKFKLIWVNTSDMLPTYSAGDGSSSDIGDGCSGEIEGVLAWIGMAILLIIVAFFLGTVLWAGFVIIFSAIYWILIRALRMIFRKSHLTHFNLLKSLGYALMYTTLYIGWVYGVIYTAMELKK